MEYAILIVCHDSTNTALLRFSSTGALKFRRIRSRKCSELSDSDDFVNPKKRKIPPIESDSNIESSANEGNLYSYSYTT